jgi:hypothetical protein
VCQGWANRARRHRHMQTSCNCVSQLSYKPSFAIASQTDMRITSTPSEIRVLSVSRNHECVEFTVLGAARTASRQPPCAIVCPKETRTRVSASRMRGAASSSLGSISFSIFLLFARGTRGERPFGDLGRRDLPILVGAGESLVRG